MQSFEFHCPTKIVCGSGSLAKTGNELASLSVTKPLVVTDQGLVGLKIVDRLYDALAANRIPYAVYDTVPPDSALTVVDAVRACYEAEGCDGLIAIGGGSVIDTTKGAAASLSCEGVDFSTLQGSEILTRDLPPLIAIPTTAGTGSEVTLVAVVADTEKQAKLSFTSYKLVPHVAILDPVLTMSLPPRLTATTGMDALTHAIEAYTSIQKNPLSDAFAKEALSLIHANIFAGCRTGADAAVRTSLALGSLMAGAAFSNAMVGIVHAIGHSLGGLCHVPHGQAMMILLPHCVAYNASLGYHDALYGELLRLMDEPLYEKTPPAERSREFAAFLQRMNVAFNEEFAVPIMLRDVGVERDMLDAVAKQARYDGAAIYNEAEVTLEAARAILEAAW